MINNYKQLTGRYLKVNIKRTILTIIGIVLSVALISSIGLFFKGIQDAEIQSMKDNYGSYHLMFAKADENLISKISNNPKVSRSGLYSQGQIVNIDGKTSITPIIASDKALELLPCKISEGKYPENNNEIAIEKWVLRKLNKNAKIGDKIKLNNKEYKLTGTLQDNIGRQYDNKGIALSKDNNVSKEGSILLVEVSQKTKLRPAIDELKKLGQKDTVSENTYLLTMQGAAEDNSGLKGLFITIGIIIGIVLVATIAVIYNSFQISVVERIKQFGLLRAIGTTPKQIRNIVLREATILAGIGIPIGLLCGIIAIYGIGFVFKLIGGDTIIPMTPSVSPKVLLISGGVGLVSIYVSAMIPAFFAGRISPLVAISSRNSITKEKIKRRRSLMSGKLFGFEGAMASKNIKRNKKRYRVTVFSVVISVVLFITFKSFMDMSMKISDSTNESDNIHFSVALDSKEVSIDNKTIDSVKSLKYVEKVYNKYSTYYFDAAMNKNNEVKEVQDIGTVYKKGSYNGSEKTLLRGSITVYDNASFEVSKKYLTSGNIDKEKMNRENGVILIDRNRIYNEKTKKSYYGPIANAKVGDEIELQKSDSKKIQFGKGSVKKVKVMAIAKDAPFNFSGDSDGIKLITTEDVCKKLVDVNEIKPIALNIIIDDVKNENVAKAAIEEKIQGKSSLKLINNIENNRQMKTVTLMIQILIYGFVVVVSLIGSVNIINTITTNIIIRKREFAALKSIGLTQRGLKKMIVLEGVLYGISGTIIGSLIGCGLSYSMFKGMSGVREFGWSIPWNAIIIAGAAAMIISYLSVLAPLSRIRKENLIEAVREDF